MKINELRIGNWVKIDDLAPEQISLETFATLYSTPATLSKFDGIPISPEWLERASFKGKFLDLPIGGYMEASGLEVTLMPVDGASGGHTFVVPCKYVHQLQNLYFALTGEELTIKEPYATI